MLASYRLIVLYLLLAWFCVSNTAHAQDVFIRPSQPTQHPVDLGLGIKPSAPPPQQQEQKPVLPPVDKIVPPTPQPTPPPRVLPQPQPQPQPSPPPQSHDLQIVPVPDEPISIPSGTGPNTFSITVQPGTMGQSEINNITKMLGLASHEIPANCTFEHLVILNFPNDGTAISMGRLTNAQQHFGGTISGIDVFLTVACKKVRRPITGIVLDQGEFYKISAQNVTCPTPRRSGSVTLSFKYLGNGKGDCQYK